MSMTSPEEALARLRRAGLATQVDAAAFAAACGEERGGRAPLDAEVALSALASIQGARGPSGASEIDRAFFVDEDAAADAAVRDAVRATFERWLRCAIPAAVASNLDRLVSYVGDVCFLAGHAGPEGEAPSLYSIDTWRPRDDTSFSLFALRRDGAPLYELGVPVQFHVHPDTEAAAAGIFREGGLTRCYREHAPACAVCRDQLRSAAARGVLPEVFRPLLG
ncbi:hypothetical protein SOCE26_057720 [Sorangium cellulosum]|uniref:Uncharacterized protein n=1 Tax=Sorangium cellulosum TaxID=56 RepID=A0A2L0EYC1_SORCE|nr:hypothetical protein [Sorangium cellulosum]AUX44308.1 hypothetical protein SOCE26_057720 [Sorangium cellulosum]